ncbi:MAG: DUF4215 domain-containing protein [Nannocystaceae bacterium]
MPKRIALLPGLLVAASPASVLAADVLVVSNSYADVVVNDFGVNTSHTLTAWDADMTPTLDQLQQYDVVLLFEDGVFANAVNVGNVLAQYYEAGGPIVTATFYLQDRSDGGYGGSWGNLEQYDPFDGQGGGCEYGPDDLDPLSIVDHPITQGVLSLHGNSYRGGANAKMDTTVLALWSTPNPIGNPDPVVGFRQDGNNCIVGISIVPHAANFMGEVSGDYYVLFDNALAWAAQCNVPTPCHNGVLEMGEQCDDGNFSNTDACVGACVDASCGDGYVYAGVEACDDGDDDNTNGCLQGCIAASCGDGYVHAGVEGCDDGNDDNTDACVAGCQLASCGDGFVLANFEECDDGNDVDGDGCSACELDVVGSSSGAEGSTGSETGSATSGSTGVTSAEGSGGSSGGADESGTVTAADSSGGGSDTSAGSAASFGDGGSEGGVSGLSGTGGTSPEVSGCSCRSDGGGATPWWLLALAPWSLRRRRRTVAGGSR